MANRSYLYSLDHIPASFNDRPENTHGLSEWPYDIPFSYRVLMSGNPKICPSLITDGLEEDSGHQKTRTYAICAHFDEGFARLEKFLHLVQFIAQSTPDAFVPKSSFLQKIFQYTGLISPASGAGVPSDWSLPATNLSNNIKQSLAFLKAHQLPFLLLETIELDLMQITSKSELFDCVRQELERCQAAGTAVDALPADTAQAAALLFQATAADKALPNTPLSAFSGLRFDDDCDNLREQKTKYPLGLVWYEDLFFDLFNRQQFEQYQQQQADT